MQQLRTKITAQLKAAFPQVADNIREYHGFQDFADNQTQTPADGILVCIIGVTEPEVGLLEPWPLRADFGLILTVKDASAVERDKKGWRFAMQVAQKVYRNCWGYAREIDVTPARITGITKQTRRNPDGTFSGVNYWSLQFAQECSEEVAIGLK